MRTCASWQLNGGIGGGEGGGGDGGGDGGGGEGGGEGGGGEGDDSDGEGDGGAAPGSHLRENAVLRLSSQLVDVRPDEFCCAQHGTLKSITWGVLRLEPVVQRMKELVGEEEWGAMGGPGKVTQSISKSAFGRDIMRRIERLTGRKWVHAKLRGYHGMKVHGIHMYGIDIGSMT